MSLICFTYNIRYVYNFSVLLYLCTFIVFILTYFTCFYNILFVVVHCGRVETGLCSVSALFKIQCAQVIGGSASFRMLSYSVMFQ